MRHKRRIAAAQLECVGVEVEMSSCWADCRRINQIQKENNAIPPAGVWQNTTGCGHRRLTLLLQADDDEDQEFFKSFHWNYTPTVQDCFQ